MDTCTSGTQRRGDRAIGPYNYVSGGETLEKVDCSIASAWVGAGAALGTWSWVKFGGVQVGVDRHKISFSLGA